MKRRTCLTALVLIGFLSAFAVFAAAARGQAVQDPATLVLALAADAKELALTKGLVVGLVGQYGRYAVPSDLLAWQMATGTMAEPKAGVVVGKNAKGEDQAWAAVEANKEGWIENRALRGRLSPCRRRLGESEDDDPRRDRVLRRLDQRGAARRREIRRGLSPPSGAPGPRAATRSSSGASGAGSKGRLYEPPAEVFFTDKDMTLPDLVIGDKGPVWAGLRLVNATGERLTGIEIISEAGGREVRTALDTTVAPLLTQKLAVPLAIDAPSAEGPVKIEIRARARAGRRTVETPPFTVELKAVAGDGPSLADLRQRDRRERPVLRRGAADQRRGAAGRGKARPHPDPARRRRRGDRPGPGLQAQGLGLDRRGHEPAPLRLRLGGLGAARRPRGPRTKRRGSSGRTRTGPISPGTRWAATARGRSGRRCPDPGRPSRRAPAGTASRRMAAGRPTRTLRRSRRCSCGPTTRAKRRPWPATS